MRFCIRYYAGMDCLHKADEVIIKYKHKTIGLVDYMKKQNQNALEQRVIVAVNYCKDDLKESMIMFEAAYKEHPQMAIMLSLEQRDIIDTLKEKGIPYFFNERCSTIDQVNGFIAAGVSDVYVCDELGFELKSVGKLCHKHNVRVRVYPNVAQTSSLYNVDGLTKFYIRPEDIDVYEDCVDVMEIFGPLKLQDTIYRIYKKRRWAFDLDILIPGLNEVVHNISFLPRFGQTRSRCGKKCGYDKHCLMCRRLKEVGDTLYDKNLQVNTSYELPKEELERENVLKEQFLKMLDKIKENGNEQEEYRADKIFIGTDSGVPTELSDKQIG